MDLLLIEALFRPPEVHVVSGVWLFVVIFAWCCKYLWSVCFRIPAFFFHLRCLCIWCFDCQWTLVIGHFACIGWLIISVTEWVFLGDANEVCNNDAFKLYQKLFVVICLYYCCLVLKQYICYSWSFFCHCFVFCILNFRRLHEWGDCIDIVTAPAQTLPLCSNWQRPLPTSSCIWCWSLPTSDFHTLDFEAFLGRKLWSGFKFGLQKRSLVLNEWENQCQVCVDQISVGPHLMQEKQTGKGFSLWGKVSRAWSFFYDQWDGCLVYKSFWRILHMKWIVLSFFSFDFLFNLLLHCVSVHFLVIL